jgi:WD40 repeat protein
MPAYHRQSCCGHCNSQNICVRHTNGKKKNRAQHGFEKNLIKCAWTPDGKHIGCGSADRNVYVWSVATGQVKYKLPGHTGSVNDIDFHPSEPISESIFIFIFISFSVSPRALVFFHQHHCRILPRRTGSFVTRCPLCWWPFPRCASLWTDRCPPRPTTSTPNPCAVLSASSDKKIYLGELTL